MKNDLGMQSDHKNSPDDEALKKLQYIPSPSKHFVGRGELLRQLHRDLQDRGSAALTQARAISGLGGIGKTQTALKYAHLYFRAYDHLFWVNADSIATLDDSFLKIASRLNLLPKDVMDAATVRSTVLQWLTKNRKWLLIYDNADTPRLLKPYFPKKLMGHVLITSRSRTITGLPSKVKSTEVEVWTLDEASDFFLHHRPDLASDGSECIAAEKLAEALDFIPLAIEQAMAYINVEDMSFARYLKHLEKKRLKFLQKAAPDSNYPRSVLETWRISFERLQGQHPLASDIFTFSAFLSADPIPEWLLEETAGIINPELAAAFEEDDLFISEMLSKAANYSLLSRYRKESTYALHRLIQEAVQLTLPQEHITAWNSKVLAVMAKAFPFAEPSTWDTCATLLVHALHVVELPSEGPTRGLGLLSFNVASHLNRTAQYQPALRLYQRSREIREVLLGEEDPSVASTLNNMGCVYESQGLYEKALELYQRSIEMTKAVLANDHPDVAGTLNNMANVYKKQGLYEKALELYQRSHEIKEAVLGEDHPDVAGTLNNMANVYRKQGLYEKALELHQRSLEITEAVLGEDHPSVADILNNMGSVYQSQGLYEKALELYQRSLEIEEAVRGDDHPSVAGTLNNMANVYELQGSSEKALELYQSSLEIRKAVLGEEHPSVAVTLYNMGGVYESLRLYEKALNLYQDSLEIAKAMLGDDHPSVAETLNNMGWVYQLQGSYEKALELYAQAFQILSLRLGDDHPHTQVVLKNIETAKTQLGKKPCGLFGKWQVRVVLICLFLYGLLTL